MRGVMRGVRLLFLMSLLAAVTGRKCGFKGKKTKCIKGGTECGALDGMACMDVQQRSFGFHWYRKAKTAICAKPQRRWCWCDPYIPTEKACQEGLSCQPTLTGHFKCRRSKIVNVDCSSSKCDWKMVYHHTDNGTHISGDREKLFNDLKNGAEVKVWTISFGLVTVQKVTVSNNEDTCLETECAHGQALFWAAGGRGSLYNLYLVFSTSGIVHVTQFFVNDPENKVRENSDIMLEMKWYTRASSVQVTEKCKLSRAMKDGNDIRVAVEDSIIPADIVGVSNRNTFAAISVNELKDMNNGMDFYPNETRLLKHYSSNGKIIVASGPLNQPVWNVSEQLDGQNIGWFVDPHWKAVYQHDASGVSLSGFKGNLSDELESGKRIKLKINDKIYEPNVVCQVNGEIVAKVFDSVDDDVTKGQWEWLQVNTNGNVDIIKFIVGGDELLSEEQDSVEVTWFVEDRDWRTALPTELEAIEAAGADVRYSVHVGNEIKWYQADFVQKTTLGRRGPVDVFSLYNEREFVKTGAQYFRRYNFVKWDIGTFTYMDYRIGNTTQSSYVQILAADAQIMFFTNEAGIAV